MLQFTEKGFYVLYFTQQIVKAKGKYMPLRNIQFTEIYLALTISVLLQSCAITNDTISANPSEKSQITDNTHQHVMSDAKAACSDEPFAAKLYRLGEHSFPVSTHNRDAQRYMNQGLNLSYGFNHAEAGHAFREAAKLDPNLAMAYWGQALVLGPNINAEMDVTLEIQAHTLVQQAKSLMQNISPREQALINALEKRYTGHAKDRTTNNKAYAQAMREAHQRFPDDQDIAILFVEAVMDLRPWGYWMPDDTPYEGIAEIVSVTEQILKVNPKHPGALHVHIHLMESTKNPEKAEQSADTLLSLVPEAGHLVHMASHIYQRVGRYADAIKSNQMAIAVDENYLAQCLEKGVYPSVYHPHNIHFLWHAATLDGQSKLAIEAARKTASKVDDAMLNEMPITALFRVTPYWALARFGHWQEILQEPAPPVSNAFLMGSWHYVRGLAWVATHQTKQAEQELAKLHYFLNQLSKNDRVISMNSASSILRIASEVLTGEIAAAKNQFDQAILHLDKAVRLDDALLYTEPPEFHFPPRLALGAILLKAGRANEAETVYWEDLKRIRNNGWALFGLMQALTAQNKTERAAIVKERFEQTWQRADRELKASRFGL